MMCVVSMHGRHRTFETLRDLKPAGQQILVTVGESEREDEIHAFAFCDPRCFHTEHAVTFGFGVNRIVIGGYGQARACDRAVCGKRVQKNGELVLAGQDADQLQLGGYGDDARGDGQVQRRRFVVIMAFVRLACQGGQDQHDSCQPRPLRKIRNHRALCVRPTLASATLPEPRCGMISRLFHCVTGGGEVFCAMLGAGAQA